MDLTTKTLTNDFSVLKAKAIRILIPYALSLLNWYEKLIKLGHIFDVLKTTPSAQESVTDQICLHLNTFNKNILINFV